MGGLARRAALYEKVREEHANVLALDAGDLFGQRDEQAREQTKFLCEHTTALGYQAFGLGEWDLNFGMDFLLETAKQRNFNFICANLRGEEDGPLLFEPYSVFEIDGLKVGVISVLGQDFKIVTMTADADQYILDSPRDALDQYLPELREKADLIILLSHLTTRDNRQLLLDLGDESGVDIAIEGHDARQYRRVNKVGNIQLIAANNQGKYVGQLDMLVTKGGDVSDVTLTLHSLDDKSPEDAELQKLVDKFAKENESKANTATAFVHPREFGSAKDHYLGAAACAQCHSEEYKSYVTTGHNRAWNTLVSKGQTNNSDCVSCHVVGFYNQNGYDRVPDSKQAGRETLKNVQCEACHGYGTDHARNGDWLASARDSCTACHDAQNSPDFDYASYWAKIQH